MIFTVSHSDESKNNEEQMQICYQGIYILGRTEVNQLGGYN